MLTNGKSDFELQLNGRIYVDDLEVITTMSVLGDGIAWLPDFLVRDAMDAGRLVPVLHCVPISSVRNFTVMNLFQVPALG